MSPLFRQRQAGVTSGRIKVNQTKSNPECPGEIIPENLG
jgi:hypothetical protein